MEVRDAERYSVKRPKTSISAGAARVHIAAPARVVRKIATDYKNYPKVISKFEKVRVVGRSGDKTDVYLRLPVLRGTAKIWAIMRFEAPKRVGKEEYITATMLRGNVARMEATFRIRPIDEQNTQLNLELLVVPKQAAPGALVTGEAARAAVRAVTNIRDYSERLTE
jgi:ribosome-associated toxin RatA of RatAB toxin-antitoxin module